MSENFSLIENAWIPIVRQGRKSLKEVFSDSSIEQLGGSAIEKVSVFKLLLSIAQAACPVENESQWLSLGVDGMREKVFSYLEAHKDEFYLYGKKPFAQMPLVHKAKTRSILAVNPEIACGNTKVLTQFQSQRLLDDGEIALTLVTTMNFALGGKKSDQKVVLTPGYSGKSASAKSAPCVGVLGFMHSFVLGKSVAETVWLNLWTKEMLNEEKTSVFFPSGLGTPSWEKMPRGEDCDRAQELSLNISSSSQDLKDPEMNQ